MDVWPLYLCARYRETRECAKGVCVMMEVMMDELYEGSTLNKAALKKMNRKRITLTRILRILRKKVEGGGVHTLTHIKSIEESHS